MELNLSRVFCLKKINKTGTIHRQKQTQERGQGRECAGETSHEEPEPKEDVGVNLEAGNVPVVVYNCSVQRAACSVPTPTAVSTQHTPRQTLSARNTQLGERCQQIGGAGHWCSVRADCVCTYRLISSRCRRPVLSA